MDYSCIHKTNNMSPKQLKLAINSNMGELTECPNFCPIRNAFVLINLTCGNTILRFFLFFVYHLHLIEKFQGIQFHIAAISEAEIKEML